MKQQSENSSSDESNDRKTACQASGSEASVPEWADLLRVFVGPRNSPYFADAFRRFESGSKVKWNWPSFFITLPWLLYRKMWLYAMAYMLCVVILLVMVGYVAQLAFGGEAGVFTYFLLYFVLAFILAPMFATRLYYGQARSKIRGILARTSPGEEQRLEIARAGSTSIVGVFVSTLCLLVPVIGILAAIAIPAQKDFTVRSQVANGMQLAGGAKVAVAEFVIENGQLPADNASADISPASEFSDNYVVSVQVDGGDIIVTYGNKASKAILGKTLLLSPEISSQQEVSWACSSPDIRDRHLPALCRQDSNP
jgi:type IV pilus assembly protein PilA